MFMHGARAWVVALTVATLGLGCAEQPSEAVIGFAFPNSGAPAVRVARDEIADGVPRERTLVRIVYERGERTAGRDA